MRLHQRLLDEINLSAIEKLSIEEFRDQVGQLVKEMMRAERVQFNQKEQDRIVADVKDERHLLRIINKIVSTVGRRVDESQPMCDARLLDGSRVNVTIAPIAVDGALMSIRKFSAKPLTMEGLIAK